MKKLILLPLMCVLAASLGAQGFVMGEDAKEHSEMGSREEKTKDINNLEKSDTPKSKSDPASLDPKSDDEEVVEEEDNTVYSDIDTDAKFANMSRIEARKFLKQSVKTEENGDMLLPPFPKIDAKIFKEYADLLPYAIYLRFIVYFDRDMNFYDYSNAIERRMKQHKKTAIDGINDCLGRKNMTFQKISFNANNVRNRLESGTPVMCLLTKSPDLNTIIADRTLDRANSEDIEEWEKTLKKKERENPITTEVKSDPKIVWGTIIGYNKKTKEFLVSGASRKPVWLTEKELGKIEQQTYTVRF